MNWDREELETYLLPLLREHLGAAAMRVLEALFFELHGQKMESLASVRHDRVLDRLQRTETKPLSNLNFRQRIHAINRAEKEAGLGQAGKPIFTIHIKKPNLNVEWNLEAFTQLQKYYRNKIAAPTITRSNEIGTEISKPDDYETPTVMLREHQIFVSHALPENEDIRRVFAVFCTDLREKLEFLPEPWYGRLKLKPWIDRERMTGYKEIENQYREGCQESTLALFVMNNKWYSSPHCQAESDYFCDEKGRALLGKAYLLVQLNDPPQLKRPRFSGLPFFPFFWNDRCRNLLELKTDLAKWDAFLNHIRDNICTAIEEIEGHSRQNLFQEMGDGLEDEVVLGKKYIPLSVTQNGARKEILPLLEAWATKDEFSNRIMALLGDFGAGKTVTMQLLNQRLQESWNQDPNSPRPVYLNFRLLIDYIRDAKERVSLAHLILATIRRKSDESKDELEYLNELLKDAPYVILLDGLDEIGNSLGVNRAEQLFSGLLDIVPQEVWDADVNAGKAVWESSGTRILITCRTHFFRDQFEEYAALNGQHRHERAGTARAKDLFKSYYLAPFTTSQIKSFLVKQLGDRKGEEAFELISNIHDLRGLAGKPLMARFIARLIDELQEYRGKGQTINTARIYDLLFRQTLARDAGKGSLTMPHDSRRVLEGLAYDLWQQQSRDIEVDELDSWMDDYAKQDAGLGHLMGSGIGSRERILTELHNASLLVRPGENRFQFAHTSFFEYFLARALFTRLANGDFAKITHFPPISRETGDFVHEIAAIVGDKERGRCEAGLGASLSPNSDQPKRQFLAGLLLNVNPDVRVLPVPLGADFSDLALTELQIAGDARQRLQLAGVNFTGANLYGCRFTRVNFEGVQFQATHLGQVWFDDCNFVECNGEPKYSASARLHRCHLDASTEGQAVFKGSMRITSNTTSSLPSSIRNPKLALSMAHIKRTETSVFSPDGRHILIVASNWTAHIWDSKPAAIVATLKGHTDYVLSAVFSPDGRHILTTSIDNTARIWDAKCATLIATCKGHIDWVISAAFSLDGRRILTASKDNTARIWDTKSATLIATLKGHIDWVNSAVFSPDGSRILTASYDRTACIWDAKSATPIATLKGHTDYVNSAVFSPDGGHILTASQDNTACIWDSKSATLIATLKGHTDYVNSAVFSPDGSRILTASKDNTARIWDPKSATLIATLKGHDSDITDAMFSPDGSCILTASKDNTARIWDSKSAALVATLKGHTDDVLSAAFSPDGRRILTASKDNTVRIWDAKSATPIAIRRRHAGDISNAAFSPDGRRILTASLSGNTHIWDSKSATLTATLEGHADLVRSAVFSPDGSHILTASYDNTTRIWDAKSATLIATLKGHVDWVNSAVFSPDGGRILTASRDSTADIWDAKSITLIAMLAGHRGPVNSAVFSPNGSRILTASDDNTARIWDAKSATLIAILHGHTGHVNSAVFSPDGSRILTVSDDVTARIWDSKSATLIATLKGHAYQVCSVVFSPDGSRILTASGDNITLWDSKTTTKIATIKEHHWITSAVFSPDGSRILTTSRDGTACIWDTKSSELLYTYWHSGNYWVVLDGDDKIIRMNHLAWPFVHAQGVTENGEVCVYSPSQHPDWERVVVEDSIATNSQRFRQ